MQNLDKKIIDNLMEQACLLLEKSLLLSEDVKLRAGIDISGKIQKKKDIDSEIECIIKESEQIRKNSAQVLSNLILILELN